MHDILHIFYIFFSYPICLSSTVVYSFVCNCIPVFKFKLTIQKFPMYKRFQCKCSNTPEEGWFGWPKYTL